MGHYQRIKELLSEQPYLIVDAQSGEVELTDEATAFNLMTIYDSKAVMHLGRAIEHFAALPAIGKHDRTFTVKEVAAMMGMEYHLCVYYCKKGALAPSVSDFRGSGKGLEVYFAWDDAFCAAIIGSLSRLGIKMKTLRKIQPLFIENENKQTERNLATSSRS
jgi:hypothetical protein